MKSTRTKQLLGAFGLLALAIGATALILNFDPNKKKEVEIEEGFELSSDIVSTDPKVSAVNFIKGNGTMGDISKVNQDYFYSSESETNGDRRENAFNSVKDAIIPDSPLLSDKIQDVIKNDNIDFKVFYEIGDLKAGNPSDVYPFIISHDTLGDIEYEAVDVLLDFKSYQHTFYWPTDLDSEPVISQMKATDEFKDVKVTLVKSGDLWFIYDVQDSEYLLNARMSTWHGKGKNDVSIETELVAEYEINPK